MNTLASRALPVNLTGLPADGHSGRLASEAESPRKSKRPRRKKSPTTPSRQRKRRFTTHATLLAVARLAPWGLAVLFLAVSMPHLADGFRNITGCSLATGWLMAVAVDSAQVVSKLQLTLAKSLVVRRSAKVTATGIVMATTSLSMSLNVLAFLQQADGAIGQSLAWTAGVLLPLLILGLSYTGSTFCLAKVARRK